MKNRFPKPLGFETLLVKGGEITRQGAGMNTGGLWIAEMLPIAAPTRHEGGPRNEGRRAGCRGYPRCRPGQPEKTASDAAPHAEEVQKP